MPAKTHTFMSKLIAVIVLTAFCLTQAGWAAPASYGRNLRQEQKVNTQASGNDIKADLTTAPATGINSVASGAAPSSEATQNLLSAYLANRSKKGTAVIPSNFYDIVLDIIEFSRRTPIAKKYGIFDRIPSKKLVKEYLDELKEKAPKLSDKNCMAEAVDNFLSDADFQLPEYAQSEQFNRAELIMALATVADIITSGGAFYADVESQPSGAKYQVLRNSLLSTIASLNAMEDMGLERRWNAVSMTADDATNAIRDGKTMLAVIDGIHMVLVKRCDNKTVSFWSAGIKEQDGRLHEEPKLVTIPKDEFFKRVTAVITDWAPKKKNQFLTTAKMAKITVGCGIIRYIGMYSDVGGYAASEDLAYRGQDNHGETVLEFTIGNNGRIMGAIRNIKVQGPPRAVLREIQINGQGVPEEALWYADDIVEMTEEEQDALIKYRSHKALSDRERYLLHTIWRNLTKTKEGAIKDTMTQALHDLMDEEGISGPADEIRGVSGDLINMYDMYKGEYFAGINSGGKFFSGQKYDIDRGDSILDIIRRIQKDYSFNISRIRDMILFELEYILSEKIVADGMQKEDADKIVDAYRRLVDRKINEEINKENNEMANLLSKEEQEEWKKIWGNFYGYSLPVAGHYSSDAVRHIFRLQSRLMGFFGSNPSWQDEVEDIFQKISGKPAEKWSEYWIRENSLNTPLYAFDALTRWFQRRFMADRNLKAGYVGPLTLQAMYFVDFKLRHDRWATTGSKGPKDAQPHSDTGVLEGIDDASLVQLIEHYREDIEDKGSSVTSHKDFFDFIREQIKADPSLKGNSQRAIAHNGDLDAAIQNGIFSILADNGIENVTASGNKILTDTWKLIAYWECVYNWFRLDSLQHLISLEGYSYARHDNVDRLAFMPKPLRDKWNEIVGLYMQGGRVPHPDLIALRIAMLEFSEGVLLKDKIESVNSEIAASVVTYKTSEPNVEHVISHNRPLYIGIIEDENGNEVAHTVSDKAALLRAFDPKKVEEGIRQNQLLWKQLENKINQLRQSKEAMRKKFTEGRITQQKYESAEIDFIKEASDAFMIFERGCKKSSEDFMIKQLYSVSGAEKFIRIRRELDDEGKYKVHIAFTDFTGRPINEVENIDIKIEGNAPAEIDVADKGGYRTFGEKDINQIPLVTLRSLINYLKPDGTVDMSAETLLKRFGESHGLDSDALIKWYKAAKEACSKDGGRPTVVISGVGSSDNDALCATALFRYLLPGVDIKPVSPAKVLITVSEYDPEKVLVIGLSWSGTTALTVEELSWIRKSGVMCISLTGNPNKEVGVLSKDSGGIIKVNTGKEIEVYTTKGFTGILYDLQILGYYLSSLFFENDDVVKSRREEVFPALYSVPDTLDTVINSKQNNLDRDQDDDRSLINEAAGHFSANKAWVLIGDMWNNSVISEIGIKIGEVRNVDWENFDYSDDRYKNILRGGLPEEEKNGVFINATSPDRLYEALENAKYALQNGHSIIIQTYETNKRISYNPILKQLETLESEYDGTNGKPKLFLVKTQYLHPKLQAILDVSFGQKFCVALARKAGLSDEAIDSPRNLAKSVTVKGVGKPGNQFSIVDFLKSRRFKGLSPSGRSPAYRAFEVYKEGLAGFWTKEKSAIKRSIQRLPLRVYEILKNYIFAGGYRIKSREEFFKVFGDKLNRLKRVIILTDAPDAQIAAGLIELPFSYTEVVSTGYDNMFKQERDQLTDEIKENNVEILINGQRCNITFDWDRQVLMLPDGAELKVVVEKAKTTKETDKVTDMPLLENRVFSLMGKEYRLAFDKKRGLAITAVFPDMLGVDVIIRSPASDGLEEEIGEDTLVIALSRSTYRSEEEIDAHDTEKPLEDIDKTEDFKSLDVKKDELKSTIEKLDKYFSEIYSKPLPLCAACDEHSSIRNRAEEGLGAIVLPDKLDATSSISAYFLALMRLGIELGGYKDIPDIENYRFAIENKTSYLMEPVISDAEHTEKIQRNLSILNNTKSGHAYTTFLVIGGAQDRASVDLYVYSLNRRGFTALPLYVDESVHGPYALIDDDVTKYEDEEAKTGVNPLFDPNNYSKLTGKDVLSVILATDSRTFGASIIDAQRNFTRSGRFILVVKESDIDKEEVQKSGAYMILTIPDAPNELTSISHAVLSQIVADSAYESLPYNKPGTLESFTISLTVEEKRKQALDILNTAHPEISELFRSEFMENMLPKHILYHDITPERMVEQAIATWKLIEAVKMGYEQKNHAKFFNIPSDETRKTEPIAINKNRTEGPPYTEIIVAGLNIAGWTGQTIKDWVSKERVLENGKTWKIDIIGGDWGLIFDEVAFHTLETVDNETRDSLTPEQIKQLEDDLELVTANAGGDYEFVTQAIEQAKNGDFKAAFSAVKSIRDSYLRSETRTNVLIEQVKSGGLDNAISPEAYNIKPQDEYEEPDPIDRIIVKVSRTEHQIKLMAAIAKRQREKGWIAQADDTAKRVIGWAGPIAKALHSVITASASGDEIYEKAWESWWFAYGKIWPQRELELLSLGQEQQIAESRAHSLFIMMQIIGINEIYDALKTDNESLAYNVINVRMNLFRDWINEYVHETIIKIKTMPPKDAIKFLKEEFASDDPSAMGWGKKADAFAELTPQDKDIFFQDFHRDISGRFTSLQTHLLSMVKTNSLDDQMQLVQHYQKTGDHILLEFLNRYRARYREGVRVPQDAGGHTLTSFPEELREERFVIDILPDKNPETLDPMPWDVPGWERLFNTRIDGYSVHIVRPLPGADVSKGFIAARAEAFSAASASGIEKSKEEFIAAFEASSLKDMASSTKKGLIVRIDDESKSDLAIAIIAAKAGIPIAILTNSELVKNNLAAAKMPGIPDECIKLYNNSNDGKAIEEAVSYFKANFKNIASILYYQRDRGDIESMYKLDGVVIRQLKTPLINGPSDLTGILTGITFGDAEWEVYQKALILAESV